MFSSKGMALKGSYEIWGEISSKSDMFDLLRWSTSLINFHLKCKKKKKKEKASKCCYHFQTVLSASQLTGSASSSHTDPVFIHHPVVLRGDNKKPRPSLLFKHERAEYLRAPSKQKSSLEGTWQQWTLKLSFLFCPRQELAARGTFPRCPLHF